jgi:hypothetical protein
MNGKSWRVGVLAALVALVMLCGTRADEAKATKAKADDAGKADDFKGKTFELKEKGKGHVTLTFEGGKKAKITVKSTGKGDVNLFIHDSAKKVVAKDDSPGPDCEIDFTPKESGKYTLEVVNLGPGATKSTLKVSVAK